MGREAGWETPVMAQTGAVGERRGQTPENHWDSPSVGLLSPPPILLAQPGPDRLDWRWEGGLAWESCPASSQLCNPGPLASLFLHQ